VFGALFTIGSKQTVNAFNTLKNGSQMNDTKYDEAVKYITSLNNSVNIVILIAKNSNNPTTSDEEKGSDGMNGDFFFDNFDDFNPWAPLRNFSDRAFAFINKDEETTRRAHSNNVHNKKCREISL